MIKPKRIGIVGGGFSGTMTAVHLIDKAKAGEIFIYNKKNNLTRGIAYSSYSDKHLLNVIAGKMSAFSDEPDHFLDWVLCKEHFSDKDREIITNAFLPRQLYGEYLEDVWNIALLKAKKNKIKIEVVDNFVTEIDIAENGIHIHSENDFTNEVDYCVIATGNNLPGNPKIENNDFYNSPNYFQNPWDIESVKGVQGNLPVLILGNGLTMVDTVLGLQEQGFRGEIFSISPNGFNILPHRHIGQVYSKLTEELTDDLNLLGLVKLMNKHIKSLRLYGYSAEPIIDSIRVNTQKIWKSFSEHERKIFMSRFRHLWGVARHRIPLHSYDKIQQLRLEGKLHIKAGRLINLVEEDKYITSEYFDKKANMARKIEVSRVINCTGPETDLMKLTNSFLKKLLLKGHLKQDTLRLGINTNTETFQVMNSNGQPHKNLFTLGSNLKGELWESTAVPELRLQAESLSEEISSRI